MLSMGEVEGYSVTSFWPRQEFDFANGGVLAFDVNVNDDHKWGHTNLPTTTLQPVLVGIYTY